MKPLLPRHRCRKKAMQPRFRLVIHHASDKVGARFQAALSRRLIFGTWHRDDEMLANLATSAVMRPGPSLFAHLIQKRLRSPNCWKTT